MSYIAFKQNQLVNLEYALNKELLRANDCGSYSCTNLLHCNTRKYHGLLICPQPKLDGGCHVLLSAVDESIVQQGERFNFGIHRFRGNVYHPKGHKYLSEIRLAPTPKLLFRVGGVLFSKETLFVSSADTVLIKYTLEDAHSPTRLLVSPFLAFRNIHSLSKANSELQTSYLEVKNGISTSMYSGYSDLYLQFSKAVEYHHQPDWHYDFEYHKELDRGYEGHEDLYVPGSFEMEIKTGESIYFAAGLKRVSDPEKSLKTLFEAEQALRIPRDSFENCLRNAGHQFIFHRDNRYGVYAGYPWYGERLRDTFLALPGLTLANGESDLLLQVLDSHLERGTWMDALKMQEADAPLWMIWALQYYVLTTGLTDSLWKKYGASIAAILDTYVDGRIPHVQVDANGLLWAGAPGESQTWMNARADGRAVTPRIGYAVEINALWYNAMSFALELAQAARDSSFVRTWEPRCTLFPETFKETFWDKNRGYLADVVDHRSADWTVRCNQVIAAGLPHSPISTKIRQLVLGKVRHELLTPRGLRTLSPNSPDYQSEFRGNAWQREQSYHQGTVFVWPLLFYIEGSLAVFEHRALLECEKLYAAFEDTLTERGIGCISEAFDADAPHHARGAISQATSVASLLWIRARLNPEVLQSKTSKKRKS